MASILTRPQCVGMCCRTEATHPKWLAAAHWLVTMVTSSVKSAASTGYCTTELSCGENPCCCLHWQEFDKKSLYTRKTVSNKFSFSEKDTEAINQHKLKELIMISLISNLEWLSGSCRRCCKWQKLTCRGMVVYECIIELSHLWFRQWLDT